MKAPTILARHRDGDELSIQISVEKELEWFEGHFPGFPVLPGVVQLHWAVDFARQEFGIESVPADVLRLKFKSVITPPLVIDLKLVRTGPDEVRFDYTSADAQHSEGRLRFAGPA